MHLPRFEYLRPRSIEEAVHLLKEYGSRAELVAGGTDLFPRMKHGIVRPEVVVGLKGVPVKVPAIDQNGDLRLDALMSLAEVSRSQVVLERTPLLADSSSSVGSNQVRHMGTLGGNLCLENRCLYYNQTHIFQFVEPCFKRSGDRCYLAPKGKKCWAVFTADTASALISLGALIHIRGPKSSREVPVEKLYRADALKPLDIAAHEIVAEVIIPAGKGGRGTAFLKSSLREGLEFAFLNVAVVLNMENDERLCREARIAVGALSTAPMRMSKAEKTMKGERPSKELFDQVAQLVAAEARLCPRPGLSTAYLRECLRVQTCRALNLAAERFSGNRETR
jgi:4-hydroxybenzoyl-CoA reductase beta subunit